VNILIQKYKKLLGNDINKCKLHTIYHSEMYFFWRYAQDYKIEKIVESGTYLGFSAKRLRKLFDCPIITFEKVKKNYEKVERVKGVEYRF